jgi:hypothetical protein
MRAEPFDESLSRRHIIEAETNYRRYEDLKSREEWGWAAVLLFYSALHLVEAHKCLYDPDRRFASHEQRNDYVYDALQTINVWYATLQYISRSVRCDLYRCSEENLSFAHGDYNLLWVEMQRLGITF